MNKHNPQDQDFPIGANLTEHGVHFKLWAPLAKKVDVVFEGNADSRQLSRTTDGYFCGLIENAKEGDLYRYRLDDGDLLMDPVSRYQPQGPEGASQIINPRNFRWTDQKWQGIAHADHVIYEMHIGTFTQEGTWISAAAELVELRALGITTIELMPAADFSGNFGWGYDGANLFAPYHGYGTADDFRAFIDRAHAVGLAVILDVVYNHLGPGGEILKELSDTYFSTKYKTDWGDTFNYDDAGSQPVRDFVLANAVYWIEEFHCDGLRIDATQNIYDDSKPHIIAEIVTHVTQAANGRKVLILAENEAQNTILIEDQEQGGFGTSAAWNDDFHHSARVALTGRREAYYTDYLGSPQEFISLAKYGYLYQGQRYEWQQKRRGMSSLHLPATKFVYFLENHDQIANSGRGFRLHQESHPGNYRAMTALFLLLPQLPLLFQGQEFGSSKPFLYFGDHPKDVAQGFVEGRRASLGQFRSLATKEMMAIMPLPSDPQTFMNSKLDLTERDSHKEIYQLHKDLLKLRPDMARRKLDGAVLGPDAFVLRYFGANGEDRLLLVNFGIDLHLKPAPEPLLAPLQDKIWTIEWSSEHPSYGGSGTAEPDGPDNWYIPAHAALVMKPSEPNDE